MSAAALDEPGTCHLVGCPGKGQHEPHGIGAPDPADWSSTYGRPHAAPAMALVEVDDVELFLEYVNAFGIPAPQFNDLRVRLLKALAAARNGSGR